MADLDYLTNREAAISEYEADSMADIFAHTEDIRSVHKMTDQQKLAIGISIWRRHISGETLEKIGESLGISNSTVKRYKTLAADNIIPTGVEEARKEDLARVSRLLAVWEPIAETGDPDGDRALKATAMVLKLMEHKAKLEGSAAPVKVEAQVTEITVEERELQDLIAQQERQGMVKGDHTHLIH